MITCVRGKDYVKRIMKIIFYNFLILIPVLFFYKKFVLLMKLCIIKSDLNHRLPTEFHSNESQIHKNEIIIRMEL